MVRSFKKFFVELAAPGALRAVADRLVEEGLVTFEVPRGDADALLQLAASLGTVVLHRDSDARGVTVLVADERAEGLGYAGFSREFLPLHTDRAGALDPPTLVLTLCRTPAEAGGESTFVDGAELFDTLAHEHPHILAEAMNPGCALFGGDGEPASASIFSRLSDERMGVRFRSDALAVMQPPFAVQMPAFLNIMERLGFAFRLEQGQGYALQNWRWLHGRTGFAGRREAYRVLVDTPSDSPIRRGFRTQLGGLTATGSSRAPRRRRP